MRFHIIIFSLFLIFNASGSNLQTLHSLYGDNPEIIDALNIIEATVSGQSAPNWMDIDKRESYKFLLEMREKNLLSYVISRNPSIVLGFFGNESSHLLDDLELLAFAMLETSTPDDSWYPEKAEDSILVERFGMEIVSLLRKNEVQVNLSELKVLGSDTHQVKSWLVDLVQQAKKDAAPSLLEVLERIRTMSVGFQKAPTESKGFSPEKNKVVSEGVSSQKRENDEIVSENDKGKRMLIHFFGIAIFFGALIFYLFYSKTRRE